MAKRPLRILLTLPQLNLGGVETHIVALATGLKERGHHVTVVSGGGVLLEQLEQAGVDHVLLPVHRKNLLTMFSLVPQLSALIKERGIQVVHAHSRVPAWISYFATRKMPRVAFLVTAHGHYNAHLGSRVVSQGQRIIAISQSVRDHVIQRLGVSGEKVDVVYNGLDLNRFHHVTPAPLKDQLTSEGFLPPGGTLVGNVGRMTKLKGLDTLLEAFSWLKQKSPNSGIRLVLIGEGPDQRHLELRAHDLGLENWVKFLGPISDPRSTMKALDIFALPSLSEGMGLSGLEAMLLGVPVVACRVPGLSELVGEDTGLLVEPKSAEGFAKAFLKLKENQPLREQLVEKAGEKARTSFSLQNMAESTESVYRKTLEEAGLAHDKLNVLQLIPELKVGGNERGVVDLSRWLVQDGHHVDVVSHGGRLVPEIDAAKANHITLPVHSKSPLVALGAIRPLIRLMREHNIHVIDAHSRVPAWIAWIASRFEKRVALVTTAHGDYRAHAGSRVMAFGERVIAVSAVIAAKMAKDFGVEEDRLRQVNRWVDFSSFDPEKTKPAGLREALGNPEYLVGILGRITHWKGHEVLIRAASLLNKQGMPLHVAIVGEPSPGKDGLLAELKALAKSLGLEKQVHFVGFRSDVPSVVLDLDLVAHCSTDPEPFGRVLLEAMAMGRPVIGTRGGAVEDIIQDGVNGKLASPKDPDSLANAIRWFLDDPERARAVASFASMEVRKKYDLGAMARETLTIYYEALTPTAKLPPMPPPMVEAPLGTPPVPNAEPMLSPSR